MFDNYSDVDYFELSSEEFKKFMDETEKHRAIIKELKGRLR